MVRQPRGSTFHLIMIALLWVIAATPVLADNATKPGDVTTPYPTITNLAAEWKIDGDDNNNGTVEVRYRQVGETEWRGAMPLRRIPAGESVGTTPIFKWDNKHSGSIFDLRPGTEYEINLKLSDPDGGKAEKTVKVRTRPVPRRAPKAPIKAANPTNLKEIAAAAKPGDVIELTPGYYREFEATADGEAGKPIVIHSDGGSMFEGISLRQRKYVHLDGLTSYGSIDLLEGEFLSVRRCTVTAKYGIVARRIPGAKNCYIADNVVTYVMPFKRQGMGSGNVDGGAANVGEGIQITGPGNVICYNYVRGFRDCISTMEDRSTALQVCIDIYNNEVDIGPDDGIEADFCMHNCRIMRNRITNCGMGVSSQPGLGGPTYFIRNSMYNIIFAPFKFKRRSVGDVALHNTVIKVGDGIYLHGGNSLINAYFRNNLAVGGIGFGTYGRYGNGTGAAINVPADETCDLDYDGVGTYGTPFHGKIGDASFTSLEELRTRTTEKHAVQVDMNVFEGIVFPWPPYPAKAAVDLRPAQASAAIDAGVVLPNINDGFRGEAPDLGAYEYSQKLPHYGPRPEGIDEETEWLQNLRY